jgi:glycerol-3-phosphate dehydrogenase (NAD(P)+)
MPKDKPPIAVLGAGSWGTALALQFARSGRLVRLWGRDAAQLAEIDVERRNRRYLPGAEFPDNIHVVDSLDDCLQGVRDILISVPSHGLRETLTEILGDERPVAVLSGPTFAKEVGDGLPTAMTIAANNPAFAGELATTLSGNNFRAYTSEDMIGVEVGGAVKNVLAIGAGISDGLGFGANTRIAMINRGLVEMTRLGVALGAKSDTFMGLAGMGDLVLTCTDDLSRNRRMGLALAGGKTVDEAQEEIQQVVEGVLAAKAVRKVAEEQGVVMPICNEIYRILYEGVSPGEAVGTLMSRGLKPE